MPEQRAQGRKTYHATHTRRGGLTALGLLAGPVIAHAESDDLATQSGDAIQLGNLAALATNTDSGFQPTWIGSRLANASEFIGATLAVAASGPDGSAAYDELGVSGAAG